MQNKYGQEKIESQNNIVISLEDLNSPVSIKNWIKDKLKYEGSDSSNEAICDALNSIVSKDKLFFNLMDEEKKKVFIKAISDLTQKFKYEKV